MLGYSLDESDGDKGNPLRRLGWHEVKVKRWLSIQERTPFPLLIVKEGKHRSARQVLDSPLLLYSESRC